MSKIYDNNNTNNGSDSNMSPKECKNQRQSDRERRRIRREGIFTDRMQTNHMQINSALSSLSSDANADNVALVSLKTSQSGRSKTEGTFSLAKMMEVKTNSHLLLLFSLSVWLILLLNSSTSASATVVRPTIFLSDTNASPDPKQVLQAQQQPSNQMAQANQPAYVLPVGQLAAMNHHQQASDGPQTPSTKVNPYKSKFCTTLGGARTDEALGMQSFAIDDLALSASSYSNEQVRPHLARLNLDLSGGAWCPMKPISSQNFGKEWIQVKLNRSVVVNAIETQGRHAGQEFAPSYQVEYSRNGGLSWHKWKDIRGQSLLKANDDVSSTVRNEIWPPIVGANMVRILPYSPHLRTVCLRFELFGCAYDEGAPIAYASTDGVAEPRWGHLIDHTYDGVRLREQLSGGLGQLVDGVRGADNYSHNGGFEWVGWKSMNGDLVLEFTFKTLRNFTGALFHSNNLFSSGVEVFQGVDVHYGVDVAQTNDPLVDAMNEQRRRELLAANGPAALQRSSRAGRQTTALEGGEQQPSVLWSADVLSIEYEPDKKSEAARPVTVHLKQRLANKLRFVLKFASKWILISEVDFLSMPVELLSLASIQRDQTSQLLAALAPAKSYDEYMAILREHQLRRIATNAYLSSFGSSATSLAPSSSLPYEEQPGDPDSSSPASSSANYMDDIVAQSVSTNDPSAGQQFRGPPIPSQQLPAGQPALWSPQPTLGQPDLPVPSTNPILSQLFPFPPVVANMPDNPQTPNPIFAGPSQLSPNERPPASGGRTIGVATVLSFALVVVLLILALLFALSSYRLRQQPKHFNQAHPFARPTHQLGGAAKGLMSPGLHNFMSVFSSAHQSNSAAAANLNQSNHYNAIFAPDNHHERNPTLRRLAGAAANSKTTNKQPGQLLVSVKDSNGADESQSISTRLIVGLNQPNGLANQQRIYHNAGQQNYPTHYSTSMSMASSSAASTAGQQADYADYAIPDAQPIIPPMSQQQQHFIAHQQPLAPFKSQFGGFHTQVRTSHHRQPMQPQTTLIQPQVIHSAQQQQRQLLAGEHNYELIYSANEQPRAQQMSLANHQQQHPQTNNHTRTLSSQLFASHCQPFTSMTLSARQANRMANTASCLADQSPGGQSGHSSGAATTTTSASSTGGDSGQSNHYYYASSATADDQQLQQQR